MHEKGEIYIDKMPNHAKSTKVSTTDNYTKNY